MSFEEKIARLERFEAALTGPAGLAAGLPKAEALRKSLAATGVSPRHAQDLLAAFTHVPAVATLWHSFFSTPKGSRPAVFVGLDNYETLWEDPAFWQSLANNFWFALGTIPASIADLD